MLEIAAPTGVARGAQMLQFEEILSRTFVHSKYDGDYKLIFSGSTFATVG